MLCLGLGFSSPAEVIRVYAPIGLYAGHWGIDIAQPPGSRVTTIGGGTVTFAGSVAGRLSVTVNHGGFVRTSYSYLSTITATKGQRLDRGDSVGSSGQHGGSFAYHLSLRNGSTYIDPESLGRCSAVPHPGLWLSSLALKYPGDRDWYSRRHVRPTPHRASGDRTRSVRTARPVGGAAHASRRSVAEDGHARDIDP
ncbi:MAG: peptidoglycan DD-metalloendopeptidase family protein [Proteobacteria bacterium]|nr:peptidoglycan DD-metalloendopeptidase family protein [Pseudomonadota bacterium]